MAQTEEQTKFPQNYPKETEGYKISKTEFKITVINMLFKLEKMIYK